MRFTSKHLLPVLAGILLWGILLFLVIGVAANAEELDTQETCPNTTFTEEDGGWVKVDGLSGTTYTFDVPDGFEVTDNCYKASTTVVYGTGDTVTSTVTNHKGKVQELSHASFFLVPIEIPEETTTTTTEPPEETTTTTEPPEETTTTTEPPVTTTTEPPVTTTTEPPVTTTTEAPPVVPEEPTLPVTGAGEILFAAFIAGIVTTALGITILRMTRDE